MIRRKCRIVMGACVVFALLGGCSIMDDHGRMEAYPQGRARYRLLHDLMRYAEAILFTGFLRGLDYPYEPSLK